MAEDQGHGFDEEHKARHTESESAQAGVGFEDMGGHSNAPAPNGSLLGDPRLQGRGNAPVHAAVMQRMQKTYGNRAVQRFLQRSASSPAIQREEAPPTEGEEELKKKPEEEEVAPPA